MARHCTPPEPWDEARPARRPPARAARACHAALRAARGTWWCGGSPTPEILSSIPVGEIGVRARLARARAQRAAPRSGAHREPGARSPGRAGAAVRTGCPDAGPGLAKPPPLPGAGAPLSARRLGGRVPAGDRVAGGGGLFGEPGPATVWARMRYPWYRTRSPAGTGPGGGRQRQRGLRGTRPAPLAVHQPRAHRPPVPEAAGSGSAWMPRAMSRPAGPAGDVGPVRPAARWGGRAGATCRLRGRPSRLNGAWK
jgi:hypothetical protein